MSYGQNMENNHFMPHYSNRGDYMTNVPSYYDYLAETNTAFKEMSDAISNTMNIDLVREIVLASDANSLKLGNITKKELSTNRWQYTIELKRDEFKENRLDNTDDTIAIQRVNDTTTRLSVKIDSVLRALNVQSLTDTLKVTREGNTIKIELDKSDLVKKINSDDMSVTETTDKTGKTVKLAINGDKWQRKLTASDNIKIDDRGNITAIGDANVKGKQDKITGYKKSAIFANQLTSMEQDAFITTQDVDSLIYSGKYFISGTFQANMQIHTPGNERGFVFVTSVEGGTSCYQEFIPWHGRGRYYRVGSINFEKVSSWDNYERANAASLIDTQEVNEWGYWSPWFLLTSDDISGRTWVNGEDTLEKKNKFLMNRLGNTKEFGKMAFPTDGAVNNAGTNTLRLHSNNLNGNLNNVVKLMENARRANPILAMCASHDSETIYTLTVGTATTFCLEMKARNGRTLFKHDIPNYSVLTSTSTGKTRGIDMAVDGNNVYIIEEVTGRDYVLKYNTITKTTTQVTLPRQIIETLTVKDNGSTERVCGISISTDGVKHIITQTAKVLNEDTWQLQSNAGDTFTIWKWNDDDTATKIMTKNKAYFSYAGFTIIDDDFIIAGSSNNGTDTNVKGGLIITIDKLGTVRDVYYVRYDNDAAGTYLQSITRYDTPKSSTLGGSKYDEYAPRVAELQGNTVSSKRILFATYKNDHENMIVSAPHRSSSEYVKVQ